MLSLPPSLWRKMLLFDSRADFRLGMMPFSFHRGTRFTFTLAIIFADAAIGARLMRGTSPPDKACAPACFRVSRAAKKSSLWHFRAKSRHYGFYRRDVKVLILSHAGAVTFISRADVAGDDDIADCSFCDFRNTTLNACICFMLSMPRYAFWRCVRFSGRFI